MITTRHRLRHVRSSRIGRMYIGMMVRSITEGGNCQHVTVGIIILAIHLRVPL